MILYIIGNGFDIAHGFKCSYRDFGEYIEKNYPQYYSCLMGAFNNDSGIWGDFEAALPHCGYELENNGLQMVAERSEIDYTPTDDEGISVWLKDQYTFFNKLPSILRAWVEDMSKAGIKPVYQSDILRQDALYLNFNYTRTLEDYYRINPNQVCHIHGDVGNINDILIMGHGSKKSIEYALESLNKTTNEGASIAQAIYQCVVDCLELTYKNTTAIMKGKEAFFSQLGDIEDVIVIGSSMSKADEPYFEAIEAMRPKHWTFYFYKDDSPYRKYVTDRKIGFERVSFVSDEKIKTFPHS